MVSTPPFEAKDSLEALQLLVDNVLVQTGKALRLSCKDGAGNAPMFNPAHQPQLPDTIRAFHDALNELEYEITDARATLTRDLNQLVARKATKDIDQPHPVSSVDIGGGDPSPSAATKDQPIKTEPASKAPFPYMGMSFPDEAPTSVTGQQGEGLEAMVEEATAITKTENSGNSSASLTASNLISPEEAKALEGSRPAIADDKTNINEGFTVMQFSLAPHNHEAQEQHSANTKESTFELTPFAHTDSANSNHRDNTVSNTAGGNVTNVTSLESSLPAIPDSSGQNGAATTQEIQVKNLGEPKSINNHELADSAFADIFANDGQADGMDFDFSIGEGGMGGDTFDDLMNDRDNTFDGIDQGEFDATYFGFDKTEGS